MNSSARLVGRVPRGGGRLRAGAWLSGLALATIALVLLAGGDAVAQQHQQVGGPRLSIPGPWPATAAAATSAAVPPADAPTITQAEAGPVSILLRWTAVVPEQGQAPITGYDLRYLETDATDRSDGNWTLLEDVLRNSELPYALRGLTPDVSYDIQVRAVNIAGAGPWSVAAAATANDHGDTSDAATDFPLGARLSGFIASSDDVDYFQTTVSTAGELWIETTAETGTTIEVLNLAGVVIELQDSHIPLHFPGSYARLSVSPGRYYIRVTGAAADQTGSYWIYANQVLAPGATRATATDVALDSFTPARVNGTGESHMFRLVLSERVHVWIASLGSRIDLTGTLLDSEENTLAFSDDAEAMPNPRSFSLDHSLDAGTYYIRVSGLSIGTGPYTLLVRRVETGSTSIATATPLSVDFPHSSRFYSATDEHYYSFTLEAESILHVEVTLDTDFLFQHDLALFDSDGSELVLYTLPHSTSYHYGSPSAGVEGRANLGAGTYFLRLNSESNDQAGYWIKVRHDSEALRLEKECLARGSGQSDPLYGCQWHLSNTHQYGSGGGQDINVEEVWATTRGEGITIAVVDDGFDFNHLDLRDNVLTERNYSFLDGPDDPSYTHGTRVTGIIVARDDDFGVRGVAPGATFYGYRLLGNHTDDNINQAMTLHADLTAIYNNSWGCETDRLICPTNALWELAVEHGVKEGYGGKGVSYIWAAGNGGAVDNANLEERINHYAATTVCSVNYNDVRSQYSERGANLWLCAPSGEVLGSGLPQITTTASRNGHTTRFGGTSAATPTVAGVVALMRAANDELTWRDVKLILAASARRNHAGQSDWQQGALKYQSASEHYWFNHSYGFGVVDAHAAVTLAEDWKLVLPWREFSVESAEEVAIPDRSSSSGITTVSSSIFLDHHVDFIEYLAIEVTMTHTRYRDLRIELVSPTGATSELVQSAPGGSLFGILGPVSFSNSTFRFGSARHLGENAAGKWTLRIRDEVRPYAGRLHAWKLTAYGHGHSPGAPRIKTAAPGNAAVTGTVIWEAPQETGGSDVTSYDMRYIPSNASGKNDPANWTVQEGVWSDGALSHALTGLAGGVRHHIGVRAVNANGPGPWSEPVPAVIPIAPGAPAVASATPGNGTLTVNWSEPNEDGGLEIAQYDLRYIRSDATDKADDKWTVLTRVWASGDGDRTALVSGLQNETRYDLQVRAVNSAFTGDWSHTFEASTPHRPGAPTIASVTQGDEKLTVNWSEPNEDGGLEIAQYDLRYIRNDATDKADESHWTVLTTVWELGDGDRTALISSLENETRYDLEVRAVNSVAEGPWSRTFEASTPYRPDAPTNVSVTQGDDKLPVNWSEPIEDGGVEIEQYDLRYIRNDATDKADDKWSEVIGAWSSGDLEYTISGLTNGVAYDVQVRAVNGIDAGPWSARRTGTPLSADASLSALAVSEGRLNPSFGSEVTSYQASVGHTVTRITVTAVANDSDAEVSLVRPTDADLNADGYQVNLSVGQTEIAIRVRAPNENTRTYTVTVTRTGQDTALTPPASDAAAPFASEAVYTVTFRGTWTTAATPDGVPSGAHFSRLVGAVHNAGATFLRSGSTASDGVKAMAELGETGTLKSEVQTAINAANALSVLEGGASTITRTGSGTLTPTLSTTHPRVTLTTMIAPSPDWFVGISGLPLLNRSGRWLPSHTVNLYPWDAGTEEGTGFSTTNSETDPRESITSIRGTGRFSTEAIATLTFELQSASTTRTVVENTPADRNIGAPVRATATVGTVTYTLDRDDGASFAIVASSGQLRTKAALDYETRDRYEVEVTATDANGSTVTRVTIDITGVDELPEITLASGAAGVTVDGSAVSVKENHDGLLVSLTATDPEGIYSDYTLALGGAHASFFTLSGGELRFNSPPNHEARSQYNVAVTASNSEESGALNMTVTVTDVNEPPIIGGSAEATLNEVVNPTPSQVVTVGTYTKSDPDRPLQTTNWGPVGSSVVLSGANSDAFEFHQQTGRLTFASPPDYEGGGGQYDVTLTANDGTDEGTLDVTVNVANVEEAGTLTLGARQGVLNVPLRATLEDPDAVVTETWTWQRSTSGNSGWMDIVDNADSSSYTPVAADRDHYLRASVTYTDGQGQDEPTLREATEFPTVNERGPNNKLPVLPDSVAPIEIPETAHAGANVGSPVRATDADNDPLTYSLRGDSEFVIDATSGQIRVAEGAAFDFDAGRRRYAITVVAADGFGGEDTVAVTINITGVNEAPEAENDSATVDEDEMTRIHVLDNDRDPENDYLTVSLVNRPSKGTAMVVVPANRTDPPTITYTPNQDYHRADSFTYRATDTGNLSDVATVTVTVTPVNDAPVFPAATAERSVSEAAEADDEVGAPVTATDVDENDTLTYSLFGTDARFFAIGERNGQITVGDGVTFDLATKDTYTVMVEADDGSDEANATATVAVTITVTAGQPATFPAGGGSGAGGSGGGGGGPSGPSPSEADFEWTVKHDIDELDAGHDMPTGMWSDGTTLWLAENGDGADDALHAYDIESGERLEEREFELDERNRAPRGVWSDRATLWIADSGRDTLFAHDLVSGERLPERDIELHEDNADARGIWSDGVTMWVLDNRADALFAYDLAGGDLLAEYALDSTNGSPHGIWSDRVTVWVSDHGARRLLAYRLPVLPDGEEPLRRGEGPRARP